KIFFRVCVTSNATGQRDRFSTNARLSILYYRSGRSDRQRRASTQQIKTLKNISSGILIALFSYRRKYTQVPSDYRAKGDRMENYQLQFRDLLKRAVSEPGPISAAYSAFHAYSIGNQLAALVQCSLRKIQVGPIFHVEGLEQQGPVR